MKQDDCGSESRRRIARRVSSVAIPLVAAAMLLTACGSDDDSSGPGATSGKPGAGKTLNVSVVAYSPYSNYSNGKATGIEAELLDRFAEELGYEVRYTLTDTPGQIAGVQAGRYDIGLGDQHWTPERTKKGLFTDPLFFTPAEIIQKEPGDIDTVAEMEGRVLASPVGYSWVPALESIPDATVRTFPDPATMIADIAAGRVDVAPTDPMVNTAALKARPDWKLTVTNLQPPTEKEVEQNPDLRTLRPADISWYLAHDKKDLESQMTEQIRAAIEDGTMAELLRKYGADPEVFLTHEEFHVEQRRANDRPSDWQPATPKF